MLSLLQKGYRIAKRYHVTITKFIKHKRKTSVAAPTPTTQILHDNGQRVIIKVVIPAGGNADVSNFRLVDVSSLAGNPAGIWIRRIQYSMDADTAALLLWEADVNVPCISMYGDGEFHFEEQALTNNGGTGVTGDILLSTEGVVQSGLGGTLILYLQDHEI